MTTTTSQIINETNYTTNSNNVIYASNSELFSELLKDKTEPKDISFEQYQTLSKEDIENLYPKDEQKEQYEKAVSLHTKANGTTDELLNQVMFDKELESDGCSEFDERVSNMLNMIMNFWEHIEALKIANEKTEQYIKDNGIKFEGHPDNWISEYAKINSQMYKETVVPENEKKMSKDEMFSVFEHNKIGAESLINHYGYTPQDKQYQYFQYMKNYEESIKDEYEKRLNENNAALASYTSNNNSTKSKIEQTQQENETKETKQTTTTDDADTKELSKAEKQEAREKILADIDSLLRTGLTVSELERLKEMLAEIKKLESKKSNDVDTIKELNEMLDKLEKAIADLQKRLHTITTEHEKDTKKIDKEQKNEDKSSQSEPKTPIEKRIEKVEAMVNDITALSKKTATGESLFIDELIEDNDLKE